MFGSKKKEPEFKFELGAKVKDQITGFSGVLIQRGQWLHNCNTYLVKPTELKDGMPQDGQAFDEPQLILIEPEVIKPRRATGGPTDPVRRTNR